MKRKLMMFLTLFFIGIGIVTAQTQVRGTVVDDSGEPVIGATIQVKGASWEQLPILMVTSPYLLC